MLSLDWLYYYLGLACLIIFVIDLTGRLYNRRRLRISPTVILELTPPSTTKNSAQATEHFFTVVHSFSLNKSWSASFLGQTKPLSLEIVSSRAQGIRCLIRLNRVDVPTFQHHLAAYLPTINFKQIEDYLNLAWQPGRVARIMEFKQTHHFAYPFSSHDSLPKSDPIAYITGAMSKLASNELLALQVVISPVMPRQGQRIRNKLVKGQDPQLQRSSWSHFGQILWLVLHLAIWILQFGLHMISEFTSPSSKHSQRFSRQPTKAPVAPSAAARSLQSAIYDKLSQPLFQATIRTFAVSTDEKRASQNLTGISVALASFALNSYQGIAAKRTFPQFLKGYYRWHNFRYRLPAIFRHSACILAVSEMAALYHFPYGSTNGQEDLVNYRSRTLPAPVSLKARSDNEDFEVILGENHHHGSISEIGLTSAERERHIYIMGGSGNGKTTMLQYAIVQDIWSGKGVAVIDPHGDLAETILRQVPEERLRDVIYFNPADLSYPIGLNVLELPTSLSGDALLLEQDFVTEAVVSIFRKLFSDNDSGGHRIEYLLRNAIRTAFSLKQPTIFTIYRLLTDETYRRKVTSKLSDIDLKNFWNNEYAKAGSFQRVKMSAGVTSKLGRFLGSAAARRVLEQPTSTIDFDDILNSGKILICNFAKGNIGEDTSALFGSSVLTKLQLAALRRSRLAQSERRPFYLYVDEFQNFATPSFLQLLSEARKYKLYLIMAEQSPSQQEQLRMVSVILANVGTLVCFRSGSPLDEQLVLPLFSPHIEAGEILNLAAYNFYIRIVAQDSQPPLSGRTIMLDDAGRKEMARAVISNSRQSYASPYDASKIQLTDDILDKTYQKDAATVVISPPVEDSN